MSSGCITPSQPDTASLFSSYDLPLYHLSIGDGILVYWDGDRKWYSGKITAVAGDHGCEVLYDDGEREWMALDKVRHVPKRSSDSSSRRGRTSVKKAKSCRGACGNDRKEVDWGDVKSRIRDIKNALLDMEDRIPLEGVYEDNAKWWQKWHAGVLLSVKHNDCNALMDSALGLSLQLKPNISTTWWVKHHIDWKKQLANVKTLRDATLVVKNLQDNAVNWPAARTLFSDNEAIPEDVCFQDEAKTVHQNESRELNRPSSHFGRSLDHQNQGFASSIAPTVSAELPLSESIVASNSELGNLKTQCSSAKKDAFFSKPNSRIPNNRSCLDVGIGLCKRKKTPDINQNERCAIFGSISSRKRSSFAGHKESANIQKGNCCAGARYELRRRKKNDSISEAKNHLAVGPSRLRKGMGETLACRMSGHLQNKSTSGHDLSSEHPDSLLKGSAPSIVCSTEDCRKNDSASVLSSSGRFGGSIDTCESKPTSTSDEKYHLLSTGYESQNHHQIEENTKHPVSRRESISDKTVSKVLQKSDQDGNYLDKKSPDNDKANITSLVDGLACSVCQTAVAFNHFVQCKGDGCEFVVHTFCLCPPLQTLETDWLCPYCKGGNSLSTKLSMGKDHKKIQSILGRRRVALEHNSNTYQDQFLVKWDSLSHHHDSWISSDWLCIFDRVRLQRFQNKYHFLDDTSLIDQRKPGWFQIDRVVAFRRLSSNNSSNICSLSQSKEDSAEFEFLVKWKGLDYCFTTWESSCTEELLVEVGKFVDRHQRALQRSDVSTLTSSNWAHGKAPDEFFKDKLCGYQLEGVNWILSNYRSQKNVILADEIDLAKTVQAISFIQCIMQFNVNPVLIIVPKSSLFQWQKEFSHWTKDLNVIAYQGEKQSRRLIQVHEMYTSEKKVLFDVLVTSYELILLDSPILKKFKWSAIIIDEAHKIKKLDSNLASHLKQYSSDFRLLLTGTPLQNNLVKLLPLLHFIDPEKFPDLKPEVESFSATGSGMEHPHEEMKVAQIHEFLKQRMLRRMKSDVHPFLVPAKNRVEVRSARTDSQQDQIHEYVREL